MDKELEKNNEELQKNKKDIQKLNKLVTDLFEKNSIMSNNIKYYDEKINELEKILKKNN